MSMGSQPYGYYEERENGDQGLQSLCKWIAYECFMVKERGYFGVLGSDVLVIQAIQHILSRFVGHSKYYFLSSQKI